MVDAFPSAIRLPFSEPPPAGHSRAAAHLLREQFPRQARAQDKENARERLLVGDTLTPAFWPRGLRWQEQLQGCPKIIFQQWFRHAISDNHSARFVRRSKARWKIEQDYRELKEELGLDHFEGRGWMGWHHHVALVTVAFAFLRKEQRRRRRTSAGKKPVRTPKPPARAPASPSRPHPPHRPLPLVPHAI